MASLVECQSLHEVESKLKLRTEDLATLTCLLVRFSDFNPSEEHHRDLMNKIVLTHSQIILATKKLEKQREELAEKNETAKAVLARLNHLKERLIHQNSNLPAHLPVTQAPATPSPPKAKAVHFDVEEKEEKKPDISSKIPAPGSRPKSKIRIKVATAGSKAASKKPKREVPTVLYITTEEFEAVPKYMRGRIKYAEVNDVIKEINEVVQKKYKILDTPNNKMSGEDMKRFQQYTDKESKETKDEICFTGDELKDLASTTKTYTLFLKIGALLRHCKRLRQIRVGKIENFILLSALG